MKQLLLWCLLNDILNLQDSSPRQTNLGESTTEISGAHSEVNLVHIGADHHLMDDEQAKFRGNWSSDEAFPLTALSTCWD